MQPREFAKVSIRQLVTDPASWIGEAVELEGIVHTGAVRSSSLKENCSSEAPAILVRWQNVPGFNATDDGAKVRVRGVFRQADGIGPKPALENVSILRRWPPRLPHCTP